MVGPGVGLAPGLEALRRSHRTKIRGFLKKMKTLQERLRANYPYSDYHKGWSDLSAIRFEAADALDQKDARISGLEDTVEDLTEASRNLKSWLAERDAEIARLRQVVNHACSTTAIRERDARIEKLEAVLEAAKRLKSEYDEDWEKGRVSVDTLEANTALGVAIAAAQEGEDE